MNKILLSLSFGLITGIICAQTIVPGGVVSGTWTSSNSPYLVQGAIMIANGTTLSIDSGVRVEFQGDYKFLVLGQLLAIGKPNDSITFTSTDTTIGWLGIRFDSTLSSNDSSKFFYCKFQYGKANGTSQITSGGALYFKSFSKAIISNCYFSSCFANNGGGIYCVASSPLITNNLFSGNIVVWEGAGIDCLNSNPIIFNNTFLNNIVTDPVGRGGGIGFYNCTNPLVDSNVFISNSALRGGAIFSSSGSPNITNNTCSNNFGGNASCISLEFSNATISHNSFTNNTGGGSVIYCEGNTPTISYNDISNNIGLGINCSVNNGGNIPLITNNIIHNNDGGGINCFHSTPIISYNFITNNSSLKGGAIKCSNNATAIIISNNVIANNSADSLGGGVYCYDSSPEFSSNTITNNSAVVGGALYCTFSSDPSFSNTIIWGNTATLSGNQAYLDDEPSDPNFSYCDIEGNSSAFGVNTNVFYLGTYSNNIDSSALFTAPSLGSGTGFNGLVANWTLLANSPCIDEGDPVGAYPPTDIAGNPRVSNGRIDMGAYEDLFTGIGNIAKPFAFEIYPNPTTRKFVIIFPYSIKNGLIEIYSVLGERIFSQPIVPSLSNQINITHISQGIYFVRVYYGENYYCKKITIEQN
jgi:predicted outer membrane repeat protein